MDPTDSPDADHDEPPVKMSKGNDVDVRILVPYKGAGVVIGRGGENIRRLREEFSAKIHLPNNYGPERLLHMSGECQNLLSILKETLPSIEECNHDGDVDLRVLINTSHAGIIIGQGGQQINELRKNCNLRILKVYPKPCPRSTDRVLKIVGQLKDVLETLQIVVNMIKDSPIKGSREDYDARNCDELLSKEYGGWGNPNNGMGLSNMMQMNPRGGQKRSNPMGGLLSSGRQSSSILGDDFSYSGLSRNMAPPNRSGLLPDNEGGSMRDNMGLLGGGDGMPQASGRYRQSLLNDVEDCQQDMGRSMRGRMVDNVDDLIGSEYSLDHGMGLLPNEDNRGQSIRPGQGFYSYNANMGGLLAGEIEMPRKRMMGSRGFASTAGGNPAGGLLSGGSFGDDYEAVNQKPGLLSGDSDGRGMKRMLNQTNLPRGGMDRSMAGNQMGRSNYSLLGAGNKSLNQFNPDSLFKQVTTLISLPDHLIGPIMGNGGSRIKSIRQESGADISVSREKDPAKNERTITIKGTQEQIQEAQDIIQICVKNFMDQNPQLA